MSAAIPTWERFSSDKHLAEPPKGDFENALPRGAAMIQRAMKQLAEYEAGSKKRPGFWHREDKPKPKAERGKHVDAAVSQRSVAKTADTSKQEGGGSDSVDKKSKHKQSITQPADLPSADSFVPPRMNFTKDSAASKSQSNASKDTHLYAGPAAKKRRSEDHASMVDTQRVRVPKFGETNDAPPTLFIGGQLSKKLAASRKAEQARADELAIQRQSAIESYARAKAARRAEAGRI